MRLELWRKSRVRLVFVSLVWTMMPVRHSFRRSLSSLIQHAWNGPRIKARTWSVSHNNGSGALTIKCPGVVRKGYDHAVERQEARNRDNRCPAFDRFPQHDVTIRKSPESLRDFPLDQPVGVTDDLFWTNAVSLERLFRRLQH